MFACVLFAYVNTFEHIRERSFQFVNTITRILMAKNFLILKQTLQVFCNFCILFLFLVDQQLEWKFDPLIS